MSIFHSSIFYFDTKVFFRLIYWNFRHFNLRRYLFTLLFILVFVLLVMVISFFRLLDEVFYPAYRKTEVKEPVFIISNPRSGTTYLHRLFCLDENRFSYLLLYHTIIPAVSFYKLVDFLGSIDRRIGRPMRRFFNWWDEKMFAGWEDIHPTGWNRSEEDEGLWVFAMMSPALGLFCPFMKHFDWVYLPDKLPQKQRQKLMNYYASTIQRFMYAQGNDKVYLNKSVMSTGRIRMILERFPNARIIYPVRNPYDAVPSFISMFSVPWKMFHPDIPESSEYYREWAKVAIEFYTYFREQTQQLPPSQFYAFKYDELKESPKETVLKIYRHYNIEILPEFKQRLADKTSETRKYKSKHDYSMEQYGLSREKIYQELEEVFLEFGFGE